MNLLRSANDGIKFNGFYETPIGHGAERKYDRHRVLTADDVGDPAEERPRHAVQNVVDHQGRAERGGGDEEIVVGWFGEPHRRSARSARSPSDRRPRPERT